MWPPHRYSTPRSPAASPRPQATVDQAVQLAAARGVTVSAVLVTHRAGDGARPGAPGWVAGRDVSLDDALAGVRSAAGGAAVSYPPAVMDAEDPLFLLYTSGSTVRGGRGGWGGVGGASM